MSSRQKSAWTKSGLHTDIVISRRQCAEWAAWYNNGEGREHPEFDIFGPFTNPQEQVFPAILPLAHDASGVFLNHTLQSTS